MNLVESYILEVYGVRDITNDFKRDNKFEPCKPMVKINMRVNCYGRIEDVEKTFFLDEWEEIKKKGWYLS